MEYISHEEFEKFKTEKQKELESRAAKELNIEEIVEDFYANTPEGKEPDEITLMNLLMQKIMQLPEGKEIKEFTTNNVIERILSPEEFNKSLDALNKITSDNFSEEESRFLKGIFNALEISTETDLAYETKEKLTLIKYLIDEDNLALNELKNYVKGENIILIKVNAIGLDGFKDFEINYEDEKIYTTSFDKNGKELSKDYDYISDKLKEFHIERNSISNAD